MSQRGGDGSSPQNAVLLTKRGDEAVPVPFLIPPCAFCHLSFRQLPAEIGKR